MPAANDHRSVAVGEWHLVILPAAWDLNLQKQVLDVVDRQPWAKHPQTIALQVSGDAESAYFLKVFHPTRGIAASKDVFRNSKAFRAWRQGIALEEAGFDAPLAVAVGERRRFRLLRRAFILTRKVSGEPLPLFLRRLISSGENKLLLAIKRASLQRLAGLIRQFHMKGFVHGDMVASNILVAADAASRPEVFYFMDNDRTRRYPCWWPQSLWKRNLIQLNRMPLPGISLQDRVRFLHAYLQTAKLTDGGGRLSRWLERKTRQRRHECDGVDASGDFRRLMSWSPHSDKSTRAERTG